MPKTKSIASPETRTELFSEGHWDWKPTAVLNSSAGEKRELKVQWFLRVNSAWSKKKRWLSTDCRFWLPPAPGWDEIQRSIFMETLCFTIPWGYSGVWLDSTFLCGSPRKDWSLRFTRGINTISQVPFSAEFFSRLSCHPSQGFLAQKLFVPLIGFATFLYLFQLTASFLKPVTRWSELMLF